MNLRPLLETLRAEANLPALAAFVASRDSILAADVTGARRADQPGDLLALADFFQIGSNAKAMLAAACATLIEEGALTWDATPTRWRVIAIVIGTLWLGAVTIGWLYNMMTF
ncbi:MAG: serine hydrolase [Chloroflexota bacterium]|jgi:CubicO group peptidase (beta-lactamase class C family)